MSLLANGRILCGIRKFYCNLRVFYRDGAVVNDGKWHHVMCIFNPRGNMVRYEMVSRPAYPTIIVTSNGEDITSSQRACSATRCPPPDLPFNGSMDDVRVYNRAARCRRSTATLHRQRDAMVHHCTAAASVGRCTSSASRRSIIYAHVIHRTVEGKIGRRYIAVAEHGAL